MVIRCVVPRARLCPSEVFFKGTRPGDFSLKSGGTLANVPPRTARGGPWPIEVPSLSTPLTDAACPDGFAKLERAANDWPATYPLAALLTDGLARELGGPNKPGATPCTAFPSVPAVDLDSIPG